MPSEIDLRPTEYRLAGTRRIRAPLSQKAMLRLGTVCGLWAGVAFSLYRVFLPSASGWWSYPIAFAPAAALLIYAVLTSKD